LVIADGDPELRVESRNNLESPSISKRSNSTIYSLHDSEHPGKVVSMANGPAEPAQVTTSQVAEALGVSVSTVKRWVDEGVLPACKTPGGHRKLLLADVIEFARRSNLPQLDLACLMAGRPRRELPNISQLSKKLFKGLVQGDRETVRSVILGAYRAGVAIEVIGDQIVAPAMQELGHGWEQRRLDVMHEHRGTQLCEAVLYELLAILSVRANHELPVAVGGAPPGDPYSLPSLLAQMVLIDAGWNAVNLGPNTPFPSFTKALTELRPRLIWVSVTHLENPDLFLTDYLEFFGQAERLGVAVALGGQALVAEFRSKLPYTAFGDGLVNLAAFARTLHHQPRQPRRGRPRKNN
jgi:excisionase family DNA binding protein